MKERPILFSAPMVRAILENRKTQTRRVVKPQPKDAYACAHNAGNYMFYRGSDTRVVKKEGSRTHSATPPFMKMCCPYGQPGDRLLVASPIPDIPNRYCAGTDGVIYTKEKGSWRPLKTWKNGDYPSVTICDNNRRLKRTVHGLVCSAFYGPKPTSSSQVRHLDGNDDNGKPENLCWGNQYENWQDRKAHGRGLEGEKHHAAKLTDNERASLRWCLEKGLCSQRHAAKVLGLQQSSISQMIEGAELKPATIAEPGYRVSRLTLEITDVRVERLQEISEEDAKAEGIFQDGEHFYVEPGGLHWDYAKNAFHALWNKVTGEGQNGWNANPWVWVIEFSLSRRSQALQQKSTLNKERV